MDLTSLSDGSQTTKTKDPCSRPAGSSGWSVFLSLQAHTHHLPPHSPSPPCRLLFLPWNSETTKNDYLPVSPPHPNQSNVSAGLNWPKLSKEKRNGGHRRHFKKNWACLHFPRSECIRIQVTHNPGTSYLSYQLNVMLLRNEAVDVGLWKIENVEKWINWKQELYGTLKSDTDFLDPALETPCYTDIGWSACILRLQQPGFLA